MNYELELRSKFKELLDTQFPAWDTLITGDPEYKMSKHSEALMNNEQPPIIAAIDVQPLVESTDQRHMQEGNIKVALATFLTADPTAEKIYGALGDLRAWVYSATFLSELNALLTTMDVVQIRLDSADDVDFEERTSNYLFIDFAVLANVALPVSG